MKIPFKDRSQMTMKEKIANPLSVKEALELSEEIQKSIIQAFNSNVAYKCYENQMGYLVGGSRLPSTPEERELEHKCNPHPNDWIDGIYSFNKLPFAVRMQKGLVTQAEEERRKGRYGYLSDLIPSCGSDASFFPGMILEPIEKFNATHFPDGREKNKAVTM